MLRNGAFRKCSPTSVRMITRRAHIFRLLLHPNKLLRLVVLDQRFVQLLNRQRIQLLDTNNGDVIAFQFLPLRFQFVIDSAAQRRTLLAFELCGAIML